MICINWNACEHTKCIHFIEGIPVQGTPIIELPCKWHYKKNIYIKIPLQNNNQKSHIKTLNNKIIKGHPQAKKPLNNNIPKLIPIISKIG